MIDEQSSASGHDYASDRSAIGAGLLAMASRILFVNIKIVRLIVHSMRNICPMLHRYLFIDTGSGIRHSRRS